MAQQQVAASVGSNGSTLGLTNIKAPKNGYAYIYISNQSNNDVFFDNFNAGITTGNIIEENHYYAYGLKIATLSSKKLEDSYEGSLKNNYLYQGAYSEMDDDIGWNDFPLRNYDAQIGRWVQQDPYQEFASPYLAMGDDPVNLIDPSGGSVFEGLSSVGRTAVFMLGGAIIGLGVDIMSGGDGFTGTAIGAGVGLAAGLGSLSSRIAVSMGIQTVNSLTGMFNSSTNIKQAGVAALNNGPNANPDSNLEDEEMGGIDPTERLRILTAIAMGEGGNGWTFNTNELVQIAYVYMHREAQGKPLGKGSSYYANKSVSYRMYMNILGSPQYAKDQAAISLAKTIPKVQIAETKAVFQELDCYTNGSANHKFIPAADNPNITIQGYHRDLNGEHGDPKFWNRVRWYVYYVYTGKIPRTNNLFVLLGSDNDHKNATFLVDEKALNDFVEKNKDWIDKQKAPIYDAKTDKFK